MTHTFATLEVSAATFDECAQKLRAAGHDQAFVDDCLDTNGIGLVVEEKKKKVRRVQRRKPLP
jgi:hypothetical protein